VLRQFVAEGLTLTTVGGALGVMTAFWGVRLLVRFAPIAIPRLETVTIDLGVLLFSVGIAVTAGLLFALLPALRIQDQQIEETLRAAASNVSASPGTAFVHDALAGSEIALCTVLLICALLLGQSLSRVLRDNTWLNEEHVLTVGISPSPKQFQKYAARVALYKKLLLDTRELPGVTNAGLIITCHCMAKCGAIASISRKPRGWKSINQSRTFVSSAQVTKRASGWLY
jgi:hypothetical protein